MIPVHLQERLVGPLPPPHRGELVLYWMRSALRGHENPALDLALALAEEHGLPLLVYQGLSERYPHASDRHHRFVLEGARDVAAELGQRGIRHVLHVERPGHGGPVLRELAGRAAAVVTEEVPVPPLRGWTRRLAEAVETPVLRVDCACVAPLPLLERGYDRAFAFRRAASALHSERLERPWPEREVRAAAFAGALPFDPVTDLSDAALEELIAACRIDHTVGPVPGERGGTRAGYERWRAFLRDGLAAYDRRRNDPLAGGVSRMSAHLHHGMVSPLRIAREAAGQGSRGAQKYLDELLVWRELAWHWCFHADDVQSTGALPAWARATLAEHEGDPRPVLPREELERGRTGDRLWDACQASLLVRGELHNNVRMTWGKALLGWSPTAEAALERTLALNHRFALDGRDPSSHGGILWCFGLFDRPHPPERPIEGSLRPRPTLEHARRLDVDAFRQRHGRLDAARRARIGVVGAGLAGLTCARVLVDHGHEVLVLDKARGPGGRTSLRRGEDVAFDHGAQYFTVQDPRFARAVDGWREAGLVAPWQGRIVAQDPTDGALHPSAPRERLVAVPGMNALAKHLARDLDLRVRTRIAALERREPRGPWTLRDEEGREHGPFDHLVLALPAEQCAALLPEGSPLLAPVRSVAMQPSIAWLVAFEEPWKVPFDGAFVNRGPLSWVARDSSKPGRPPGDAWVVHSTAAWAHEHLEEEREHQATLLRRALAELTDVPLPPVLHEDLHRWRYALTEDSLEVGALHDPELGLLVCGDWCAGSRVEGAWLSGAAAAGRLLGRLAR